MLRTRMTTLGGFGGTSVFFFLKKTFLVVNVLLVVES